MNPEKWVFIKSLILPFLFFGVCSSTSTDTITPNQSIKDGDLLLSSGETFALGFFSLGNSNRRYAGIWYYKIPEQTVVWVANRDSPIINSASGVPFINKDGNLIIYNKDKTISFWQTNVSTSVKTTNYSARLMKSGNLILFHGESRRSSSDEVAWQSFDHPTNTFIPGLKLGLDRRTGLDRFLTSWKSRDDPGTGEYSYSMDPSGLPQLFLYKGSARIWRSGPWIGKGWAGIAEMRTGYLFNTSYVDNKDELSVMHGVVNSSLVSTIYLDELGSLKRITRDEESRNWVPIWSAPKDRCENYEQCGPNGCCDPDNESPLECTCLPGYEPRSARDWYLRVASAGCVRKFGEMCGKGDGFLYVGRAKVPDTTSDSRSQMSLGLSIEHCTNKCLSNCSCSAYTSGNGGECVTWYGNLTDVRKFPQGGFDLHVRVNSVELARHLKKHTSFHGKKAAIGVTSAVVMLLLIVSFTCWSIKKRKRGPKNTRNLLTWRRRLDIIVGICRELLYLHCDSRLRDIHMDLKATNVLLDGEMNPKISDFGLARAFGGDQSSTITKRVVGT